MTKLILGLILASAILLFAGSASAADVYHTCVSTCVEYLASECKSHCPENCVPTPMTSISQCKIGLCFDPKEGTCQSNAPKASCESHGGVWSDDPNMLQCKKGCCVMGTEAFLSTQVQCTALGSRLGLAKSFKPEANTVLKCMNFSQSVEEGACVISPSKPGAKKDCKFESKNNCLVDRGEFHSGVLCSNADLNTNCERQKTANCVDGRGEVYWFDSCGNRENIYDVDKTKSWNGGKVMGKNASCAIGSSTDSLRYQATCGNCNYITGSKCGNKTDSEKLSDQNVVCRDLSCIDENGKKRAHGESWCAYQSDIGTDGSKRSVDSVGSRHFRRVCYEGSVRLEPCADYRNEICVEDRSSGQSTSGCVTNLWAKCLNANSADTTSERADNCRETSDFCFMKSVNVDEHFKFGMCVPKYPPGYGSGADACASASQECKVTYVKDYDFQWKCKDNCDCLNSKKFTEEMNDLCMSLGDCGAKQNLAGTVAKSYRVRKAERLSSSYLNDLSDYAKPVAGKYAKLNQKLTGSGGGEMCVNCGDASESEREIGAVWSRGEFENSFTMGWSGNALRDLSDMSSPKGAGPIYLLTDTSGTTIVAMTINPAMVMSDMMVSWWGVSESNFIVKLGHWVSPAYWLGVGEHKHKYVKFSCLAWDAPSSGKDCEKCGRNGFPCTEYACNSLGQPCKIINGNTSSVRCINFDQYGVRTPMISPLEGSLGEEFRFSGASETGVQVESSRSDGCISALTPMVVGIKTDMPSKCKYSSVREFSYANEDEETVSEIYNNDSAFEHGEDNGYFGDSLRLDSHSKMFFIPSLESLGRSSNDPDARADYNIYVKCESPSGQVALKDYAIKFCVKRGIDVQPPAITQIMPSHEFVRYRASERNVSVFVSEPADCRWSKIDSSYDSMPNNFTCLNDYERGTLFGWGCNTTLPITGKNDTYYAKCLDQPWETNYTRRNPTGTSKVLKMLPTPELNITSATPDKETIAFGVEPATVVVNVGTSGGADGKAQCFYSFGGAYYLFSDTGGSSHKTEFTSIINGDYVLWINCTDVAGNGASKKISFKAELDTTAPKITRLYGENGALIVRTNEPATCAVSKYKCNFDFENGTIMTGDELQHTISYGEFPKVYVMCKDKYGNTKGECDFAVNVITQ